MLCRCKGKFKKDTLTEDDFFIKTSLLGHNIYSGNDSLNPLEDSVHLRVNVSFNNESGDTIEFKSMSCSYDFEFVIIGENCYISPSICFANFPKNILIPPKEKVDRVLGIVWTKPSDGRTEFVLGYIPSKRLNDHIGIDTLWSKPQMVVL